jgi:hypothetical protein
MAKQDNYFLLDALAQRLEGEVAVHKANIRVYMQSATGIGEHPQLIEAIEAEVAKLAESQEKLDTIDRHFQV